MLFVVALGHARLACTNGDGPDQQAGETIARKL
jgi:hypothetical protein